jgi:hypothetical protein
LHFTVWKQPCDLPLFQQIHFAEIIVHLFAAGLFENSPNSKRNQLASDLTRKPMNKGKNKMGFDRERVGRRLYEVILRHPSNFIAKLFPQIDGHMLDNGIAHHNIKIAIGKWNMLSVI